MDRITIKMAAKTNLVSYEVQTSQNVFPISLVQMILAEAARQLEARRREGTSDPEGKFLVNIEEDFKLDITFTPTDKRVALSFLYPSDVSIAQMSLDEVIRLVNEQRSYVNVKLTQQRLAEEAMASRLGASLRV